LAQVLLTEKLLLLTANPPSKIINVASAGQESIDFSDLSLGKGYDGFKAYRRSKTALIMYTIDLAGRLKKDDVKVNALHPATYMNTKMVLDDIGYSLSSVEDGADAVEFVIDSEQSGNYYDGKKLSRAIPQVYDVESRKNLWQMTTEILKDYL
jgi:NAD(P)-dependent dehydrogenase (short-subunit alcohol dehydrogenase family)